jgi:asparagine synthase (glutamine-hydrolysing)
MCGIFGILAADGGVPKDVLDRATLSLAHRGPDDSGTSIIETGSGGQLGFAHTRLSIIDLSPLGHQPMSDPATGNQIVFNGEIYNFRELRAELESAGNRFQSHSDTEVILAGYRVWGERCFPKLRGMFAFALWDANRNRLLLVRDPMGIKPLYYYRSARHFLFASEVRTLLQTRLVPRKLDANGLFSFLAFGSVYEPRTIVEGISAVPPGNFIAVENGGLQDRGYSNPLDGRSAENSASAEIGAPSTDTVLKDLPGVVHDAVLSHLVSDVPVGIFLSGGIDSSSLVAVMSLAGIRPATFSLVFREKEFNEAEHSRLVARRFKTDHHEIMVSQEDALASLPEALRAMDQPTIDGINTWLVSVNARTAGVKVALTGLGADEMFAGYSNFRRVPRMEQAVNRFARLPSAVRKPVAASLALLAEKSDRNRKLSFLASGSDFTHPYFLARTLFTPSELQVLYAGDYESGERELKNLEQALLAACQDLDPVNRVSYLESTCYMRNTLLRDSDFMSMAHGLELRVPFLDHALVRACFRIPGNEKLRGDSPKALLLTSLGVDLPREIVHRPKRGFALPFERWMRGELRPLIEQALQHESVHSPCLNPSAITDVWNRFLTRQTSWSRPWSLFVLQRWCQQNL